MTERGISILLRFEQGVSMIELFILGSGSRGNSALLRSPGSAVLIDAGLSARQLVLRLQAVGQDPGALDSILITHEHTDHTGGVPVFTRRFHTPVFANEDTIKAAGHRLTHCRGLVPINNDSSFRAGEFDVTAFPLPHDAADPVGFVLETGGVRTGYATDLGHVSGEVVENLSGCDIVVIETNHDRNMLLTGPYPRMTKQRIDSDIGHLSNEHAAEALPLIVGERTSQLVMAHLSEINNIPRLARAAIEGAMRYAGIDGVTIHTATQNRPTDRISC